MPADRTRRLRVLLQVSEPAADAHTYEKEQAHA